MESFRSRLDFANISIKTRVLSKVVENISNKITDRIIPDQIPELLFLWEKCNDESPVTSKLCCQSIISLVSWRKLNSSSSINELLSVVTSFKHMGIFVQTVKELLLLNMNEQFEAEGVYRCPYSVSMPMHPFIVILRERAESWPVVYQCMHSVIQEERRDGMEIMKPVISYVLLEPSSTYTSGLRTLLYDDLLSFQEGRRFILDCLPMLHPKSLTEMMEAVFVIERLSTTINESSKKYDIEKLLIISLSLCQITEFPCTSLIMGCKGIFKYHKISSLSVCICVVLLSELITDAVGTELYHLLCLGEIILKEKGITKSISSILILPLLSVLSGNHDDHVKNTAAKLIIAIEEYNSIYEVSEQISENELKKYLSFGTLPVSQAMQLVLMLKSFEEMNDEVIKEKWLDGILGFIKLKTDITPLLINVTASILINSNNMKVYKKCLSSLELVSTIQPEQSMSFLPLLLYKIRLEVDPLSYLTLLESLPCVATNAYSVGAVLNTIRLLAHYPKLKPQAISLMVLLWKKQERCFPYLKKMLEMDTSDTSRKFNEVLISQASAMKIICDTHPHLYGTDILANISKIFNTCSNDASSPAVALALQSVSSLCRAEAIDLRTAWKALARKLANDKRPLVLKNLFGVLSLAPELKTTSQHYEKFMTAATEMLWKHIRTENDPLITGAAFTALAQYPPEYHQLKALPDVAKAKIVPPRLSTPLDLSKNIEELFGYVPGYCFVHLLESISNNDIVRGYEDFLAGWLNYEVSNMPKNIYHTGQIAVKQTKCDRLFSSIPEFLCIRYNDNRQPGMQGNLAFGVLLSYHPPVEIGRDGQPTKSSILSEAEFYQQMLGSLLQDVTVDSSDWYQCILLSYGWYEFIDRVFNSCIESEYLQREIEKHKQNNGQTNSVEQMNIYKFVLDSLLKMIQNQSKGKPTSQANALLAVVGLTVSIWKYKSNLNQTELVVSDNSACSGLLLSVLETLLCALEPHRQTSVHIFSWLISSQRGGVTSSVLQGFAALSFFHLVPILIHSFPEYITAICKLLLDLIIMKSGSVLQFHCGIGMGLFLQALCRQQQQSDSTLNVSVSDVCKQLESLCHNNDDEIQLGPFLGLSLAGMSLCEDVKQNAQKCGREIQAFCVDLLKKTNPLSVSYDVLAQCTGIITVSAQVNNLLESDAYKDILELLDSYRNDRPQCCGSAAAVGAMTGLLHNSGYLSSEEEKHNLLQGWKSAVLSEKMPILQRVAALKGLSSLYGTHNCIHSLNKKNLDLTDLHELIQVAMKLFQTRDVTLKSMAVCLLGEISRIPRISDTSSLPNSYFYLDEKYVLKYIVDFVIQYAKTTSGNRNHLLVCLRLLGKQYPKPFPPISWQTVLSPFLQEDTNIVGECVKVLISQCVSSSSTSSFLESLIRKPEVVTSCDQILISSLPILIKHFSAVSLRYFTSAVVLPLLRSTGGLQKFGKTVLEKIFQSLSISELPLATSETLHSLLINIASICFPKNITCFQEQKLTSILCNCLSLFSDDMLRNMIDKADMDLIPALILACGLIKLGRFPLNYINSFLDKIALLSKDIHKISIEILLDLFESYAKANAEKLKISSAWLLELMGQVKSEILSKSIYHTEIDFLIYVYISAVVGFSGTFFTSVVQANTHLSNLDSSLLPALSSALPMLLEKEPWTCLIDKTMDWLLLLVTNGGISDLLKCSIFTALCSLYKFKEYAKFSIYSQVLNLQS